ncbi:MAG: hypothetical protein ACLRJV_08150 [Eubacteriales bacterium]
MTGKVRHSLSFEDEVKPRSRKNPVTQAGLKAGRSVDLAAHSKIRQVEKENVGTEAAHKTEFAAENLATGAIRKGYHSIKDAPYRRVERLEVKVPAQSMLTTVPPSGTIPNCKHSLSAMFQKRKQSAVCQSLSGSPENGGRGAAVAKKQRKQSAMQDRPLLPWSKTIRGFW